MKRRLLTKQERLSIYNKYNGHCAYCGCEIEYEQMQVDHIKPLYQGDCPDYYYQKLHASHYGDNSIENMNPSCRACNFRKGTCSVEMFRSEIEHSLVCLNREFTYRFAIKYGLVKENPHKVRFYFENHHEQPIS